MPWDFALIYVFLAIVAPWRGAAKVRELLSADPNDLPNRSIIYVSSAATQWVLAAFVAWRALIRGFTWAQLGVYARSPLVLVAIGVAFAAYLIAIQLFIIRRALKLAPAAVQTTRTVQIMRRLMPETFGEVPAFILLALTAGICEEFLYRGFVYAHLASIAGPGTALLASSVLFGIAHLYQGKQGVIGTFIVGLVLGASRLWTGSLLPGAVAHFLFDLSAGLLVARWIRRAAPIAPSIPAEGAL